MTTVTRRITFTATKRRERPVLPQCGDAGGMPPESRISDSGAMIPDGGRVPRIARLIALAIRFDSLIREGVIANQSELARLTRVTQPRMTQIMNLLNLAPDLQEELLHSVAITTASGAVTERAVRSVVSELRWSDQRRAFRRMLDVVSQADPRLARAERMASVVPSVTR